MNKCALLIKDLSQIHITNSRYNPSASSVEQVIISLLRADKIESAISVARDIHPSREFASVFASGIRLLDNYDVNYFIEMKAIAEEDITEEEADAILREYTGPDGKNRESRTVPKEILRASSKEAMKRFFQWRLEDKTVGGIQYAKEYWPFLEQKI